MEWGFGWLLSFVNAFWGIVANTLVWFYDGVLLALKTGLYWIVDGFFTAVEGLLVGLNLGSIATAMSVSWGLLPAQLAYIVNLIGIANGLSLIGAAMVIRMTLNLIPSWATRI